MKKLLFNRKQLLRAIYLACMAAFMMGSAHAQTVIPASVVAPYSADLTGGGSFTTTGSNYLKPGDSASWTPSAGGFQGSVVSAGFYSTVNGAATTVSNLGTTPTNFVETADMSVGSFSGYQAGTISLLALGNGTTTSGYNSVGLGYAAGMTVGAGIIGATPGTLSIGAQVATSGAGSNFGVSGPTLTFNAADTYHFVLQGTYGAGNDLTLTLTVTDLNNPSNTGTLTSDIGVLTGGAPTLTGQNFGAEVGVVKSGVTDTVSNFSISTVAVPEPSTYALLGAGVGALVLALRRRSKLV